MKKILFFTAILSSYIIHTSDTEKILLGVQSFVYKPHSRPYIDVLVFVKKKSITGEIDITVTPFNQEILDSTKRLDKRDRQAYLEQIEKEVRMYCRQLQQ